MILRASLAKAGLATVMACSHAAELPPATNLSVDGRLAQQLGKPIVILFSLPDCSYCNVVRQNYLAPLLRDLPEQQQPLIREAQLDGSASLIGFHGEQISQRALARHYRVRFAPTVLMLDGAGNLLTSPIVGGDTVGLYGGYLDNAFSEAARKLEKVRQPEPKGRE